MGDEEIDMRFHSKSIVLVDHVIEIMMGVIIVNRDHMRNLADLDKWIDGLVILLKI